SRRLRDGFYRTAAGKAGKGARGDRRAGGKLQGDAGEIRTRTRRVFRHDLAQRLRDRTPAVLVVDDAATKKPGARGSGLSLVTELTSDDSSGGDNTDTVRHSKRS